MGPHQQPINSLLTSLLPLWHPISVLPALNLHGVSARFNLVSPACPLYQGTWNPAFGPCADFPCRFVSPARVKPCRSRQRSVSIPCPFASAAAWPLSADLLTFSGLLVTSSRSAIVATYRRSRHYRNFTAWTTIATAPPRPRDKRRACPVKCGRLDSAYCSKTLPHINRECLRNRRAMLLGKVRSAGFWGGQVRTLCSS